MTQVAKPTNWYAPQFRHCPDKNYYAISPTVYTQVFVKTDIIGHKIIKEYDKLTFFGFVPMFMSSF